MIKLFQPYINKDIARNVMDTLFSGCLTQGPKVEEFEREFSKLFNVNYAISLNSGTSALETAYDLIGLKEGDIVITTPLTCTATNIPLLARGVKIIWADIEEDTLCIDPLDVMRKYTEEIKAVIQVHLGGIEARFPSNAKVPVISDACQALGIFSGDMTVCSFQSIKHITTGDGGMLIVNNEENYKKAKLMRWFGIDRERSIPDDWTAYRQRMMSFDIEMLGYKRHMNDIAATMGLAGLREYHNILEHRKKIFNIYREAFKDLDEVKLIDGEVNVYWLATLLVNERDNFARKLFEAGIECNLVQIRNDRYSIFNNKKVELPIMNKVEGKYISIPLGCHVTIEDANYIVDIIKSGW